MRRRVADYSLQRDVVGIIHVFASTVERLEPVVGEAERPLGGRTMIARHREARLKHKLCAESQHHPKRGGAVAGKRKLPSLPKNGVGMCVEHNCSLSLQVVVQWSDSN